MPEEARQHPQSIALELADRAGMKDHKQVEARKQRLLVHPDLVEADISTLLPILVSQHNEEIAGQLIAGLHQRGLASADLMHQLAEIYEHQGELSAARSALDDEVQTRGAATVPLLAALARIAFKQRDYKGTLGYLAHARDMAPQDAALHFFFGMVCVEMDLHQEAYQSLKKAVELGSGNAYFNYAFGAVLMNRNNAPEAYPYFKRYCELKPLDVRGHLALGEAYFYGHDYDLARSELKRVVNNPVTAATAALFLGRLANGEGKSAEAWAWLQDAIRRNPRLADAHAELGAIYTKRKQYRAAEVSLRTALKLDSDNSVASLNLMRLYQLTKDPRAEKQRLRLSQLGQAQEDLEREFLRTIEVQPY